MQGLNVENINAKNVFCKKEIMPKIGTKSFQPFLTLIFRINFDVFELILDYF